MEQLAITVPSTFDVSDNAVSKPARTKTSSHKPAIQVMAEANPIAHVVVEVGAPQVDRVFDYRVPAKFDDSTRFGARVRVRFAGRLVDGFVVGRSQHSDHEASLSAIVRVNGAPVLTPEIAALARVVADRYAGSLAEILRDAIPARHAAVEREFAGADAPALGIESAEGALGKHGDNWTRYRGGQALLDRLGRSDTVRAALCLSPADDAPTMIGDLVESAVGSALVVVPDARDVARFAASLTDRFGGAVTTLTADLPAAERYRRFLSILALGKLAGARQIVVGTRNAVFAPVSDLNLLVMWDDGDPALVEPRSPGWHAREVIALRSEASGTSLVLASHSRSVEVARMASTSWVRSVEPHRARVRDGVATIRTADDRAPGGLAQSSHRIPQFAWQTINEGIATGPVLVQVARAGYLPGLACSQCREPARCQVCTGPLIRDSVNSPLCCCWCAAEVANWSCAFCHAKTMRAMGVGSQRTAEELTRMFPEVSVRISGRAGGVINTVGPESGIVVATVGAEPIAVGGYQAAVLLDGPVLLARSDLRSEEETVARWFNVLSLVKGADRGGAVAITAEATGRAVQAIVRLDPIGWASRELIEREETRLPPTVRAVSITGSPAAVDEFAGRVLESQTWRTLGPVSVTRAEVPDAVRLLIVAPLRQGQQLSDATKVARVASRGRHGSANVQVRIDPVTLF